MNLSKVLLVSVSCMTVLSYSDNLNASPFYKFNRGADEFTFIYTGVNSNASLHTHRSAVPRPLLNATQTLSEQRDLFLAEPDTANRELTASVCFITDAGHCSGNDYGGANTPDNSSGGTPSGSSSGGDACAPNDAWCLDNKKRCEKEGYTQTACSKNHRIFALMTILILRNAFVNKD